MTTINELRVLLESEYGVDYMPPREDYVYDSYLPWGPLGTDEEDEDFLVDFIDKLLQFYELYGPLEFKGNTININETIDAEVGDDHIQLTDAPLGFLAELIAAEWCMNAQVSEKDTFISSSYGNYSESYMLKPSNHSELYQGVAEKNSDSIYLDVGKIRTILPVCSMRQKHSDTVSGKISLLGNAAVYRTQFCGFEVTLAQVLQNVCLGLQKEFKFPYLPTYLGGFGSPVPFHNRACLARQFLTYKNGRYYEMLGTIASAVYSLKHGHFQKKFLTEVKGEAESWQDWYQSWTKYVPTVKLDLPDYVDLFKIGKLGEKGDVWDNAARKLLQTDMICTRTQLAVHDHVDTLTTILLSSENSLELRNAIEDDKRSQRARSAFKPQFLQKVQGLKPEILKNEYLDSLLDLTSGGNDRLKSALKADEIFDGKILNLMKRVGPLSVSLGMVNKKSGIRYPHKFDQYFEDYQEYVEYQSLYDYVRSYIPLEELKRNLISDDEAILAIAKDWSLLDDGDDFIITDKPLKIFIVTTNDTALCKKINRDTGLPVFQIRADRKPDVIRLIEKRIREQYPNAEFKTQVDQGSYRYLQGKIVRRLSGAAEMVRYKYVTRNTIDQGSAAHRPLREVRVVELGIKPDGQFDRLNVLGTNRPPVGATLKKRLSVLNEREFVPW